MKEETSKFSENILKDMQFEIDKLKLKHPDLELDEFYKLYKRFLKIRNEKIQWDQIGPPKGKITPYKDLSECLQYNECKNITLESKDKISKMLSKLAVLKLNGGLGTTMGCVGPKSAIKVRDGKNFIDLIVSQLEYLNNTYECNVPLVLMNSFNTDKRTSSLIKQYDNIRTFNQSKYPRISAETLLPIEGEQLFYPPGHGDLFKSLEKSGMLDELLNEGKEYIFVSNVDNLAATVDLKILNYVIEQDIDFCMEVTDKTRADVKGGTLIDYNNALTLLEIAQVPSDRKSEFTSVRKFKIFNTNSIWINLKALKEILNTLELDIIQNKKEVGDETVIQLEIAMGSAIRFFKKACGINVPRSRFLPVKTCSDLFLLESNLYIESNGFLKINKNRTNSSEPIVKLLGKNFKKIPEYQESFSGIPDIVDLDILTVTGNVTFGKGVVLKGIVIISAPEGSVINIPDGAILEDKVIFGNLPLLDL